MHSAYQASALLCFKVFLDKCGAVVLAGHKGAAPMPGCRGNVNARAPMPWLSRTMHCKENSDNEHSQRTGTLVPILPVA